MNRIDTSQVVDPAVQQPWTTKSLNFLQDSINATIGNVVRGLGGAQTSPTPPVAIYGMTPDYTGAVIAGAFYGGSNKQEIFTYPGGTVITGMAHAALVPDFSYDLTVDPVVFSDGISRNVHSIRKYKIIDIGSGSLPTGGFLYSSLHFPNLPWSGPNIAIDSVWDAPISCVKVNNIVYLSGRIQCAIDETALGTINRRPTFLSCTLPVGYRPGRTKDFIVPYITTSGDFKHTIFQIADTGVITIPGGLQEDLRGFFNFFYVDGLSFYADVDTGY